MRAPLDTLPDLSAFPNVAALLDDAERSRFARRAAGSPDYMYRVLCDADERAHPLRSDLERLISAGQASGIADSDLLGRLRSGSTFSANSARAELEANLFFKSLGVAVAPRPAGHNRRKGDLELGLVPPVFVEIKAVMDREFEDIEQRIWQKLKSVTKSARGPSVTVMLQMVSPAWDFRARAYRTWLEAFLQCASSGDEATYADSSGLAVTAKILEETDTGDDSGPSAMLWTGVSSVHNHDFYRASLEGAYEQLPDERPAIIVLRSFLSFGNEDYGIERAVLGTQSVRIPVQGPAYARREPDGFFWAAPRNRVSAVAVLKSKWTGSGPDATAELSLDVIHNPMARNGLDWQFLRGPRLRHLVPINETEMKWHE